MDTKFIQLAVQKWLYEHNHHYQALNFSRVGYFEADVFGVTLSRMVTEVEVKISVSDYKADFKKKHKHRRLDRPIFGDFQKTPNRFYFACPKGMLNVSHCIPEHAGLIWVDDQGNIELIKKAPLLHNNKAPDKLMIAMLNNLTCKTIFGCQYMTYKNRLAKAEFEARQREKEKQTADFIAHAKNLKKKEWKRDL